MGSILDPITVRDHGDQGQHSTARGAAGVQSERPPKQKIFTSWSLAAKVCSFLIRTTGIQCHSQGKGFANNRVLLDVPEERLGSIPSTVQHLKQTFVLYAGQIGTSCKVLINHRVKCSNPTFFFFPNQTENSTIKTNEQVYWCTPVTPATWSQRREDLKFKAEFSN